ncbi:MAG: TRAP transporter small permease [Pseudomonadota bacterium]
MAAPDGLLAAADRLGAVNRPIADAGRAAAGALLIVMTFAVMAQVVARYGLNSSLSWSEELSKGLMVWTAFLVAPWAYRSGANVSIEIFADAIPAAVRRAATLIITLGVIWICAVFFRESLSFVARGMQSKAASLPVPTGVFYAILPASFLAVALCGAEQLLRDAAALAPGSDDARARALRREG